MPHFLGFGGKSRVAHEVWRRLGDVPNYVEPFFGSGAVLLGRPHSAKTETVNDLDGYVANFWRAMAYASDDVAAWADWPVNENDLLARHIWLVGERASLSDKLHADPEWFDAKIAGWWVWGICSWIGSGWCSGDGPWSVNESGEVEKVTGSGGVNRKRPHLSGAGQGINRQIPHLGGGQVGGGGRGINRDGADDAVVERWFAMLGERMRSVRVCSGDWSRVVTNAPTANNGLTGVFLDPPYSAAADRADVYAEESFTVAVDVRNWCIANGGNAKLRIALCGYEGEGHEELEALGWSVYAWKAAGGYGGQDNKNAKRERIWFSQHCLRSSYKTSMMVVEEEEMEQLLEPQREEPTVSSESGYKEFEI